MCTDLTLVPLELHLNQVDQPGYRLSLAWHDRADCIIFHEVVMTRPMLFDLFEKLQNHFAQNPPTIANTPSTPQDKPDVHP